MNQESYPSLTFMADLAQQAGKIMTDNFKMGMARTEKADKTPLTASDQVINDMVRDAIRTHYPHVQLLGEEGNHLVAGARYEVYLDPVDGTIPFCRGLPVSTFCMAVKARSGNTPLAAVIYDPFLGRMWLAAKGEGTFLNGKRAHVSACDEIPNAYIGTCWWDSRAHNMHAFMGSIMDTKAKWVNLCSIAIFGGLVASGEFDASIFMSSSGLETLAMQLIVKEAGGVATDLRGNRLFYDQKGGITCGHLITNGVIHDKLVRMIKRYRIPRSGSR